MHHRNAWHGRIGLVFTAEFDAGRHGEPVNREPHKCGDIRWFPLDALPSNTDSYTVAAIAAWQAGTALQLSGWQAHEPAHPPDDIGHSARPGRLRRQHRP